MSIYIIATSLPVPFCHYLFVTDPPTTEIYPLSLHDALPISHHPRRLQNLSARAGGPPPHAPCRERRLRRRHPQRDARGADLRLRRRRRDRKSTRLNSSHANISYAVFCLKKKKTNNVNIYNRNVSSSSILSLSFCY